ncbi:MAG: rhomboid family intramembrane serine protease [Solirubrobacteraceae bacterium]
MIPLKDDVPTSRLAIVTYLLIAVNVIVYLYSVRQGGSLWSGPDANVTIRYGAIPYEFSHSASHCGLADVGVVCQGQPGVVGSPPDQPATWLTALTSMFMHGSLLHLAGNMLFLYIFGNNVEDSMGRVRFIAFYIIGGLAALALQIVVDSNSAVPTVGASGAIAAVLGGYILLFPRARVLTVVFIVFFFTVIELPALAVLGIWFAEQALLGSFGLANPVGGSGGVAYFAHVGGFVFGLALIKAFARRRAPTPPPPPPTLAW